MANVIEIEPDTKNNNDLGFMPLWRSIRGRFDFNRMGEREAKLMTIKFPDPIPGQRLGIDLDAGEGYIVEPLHHPEHRKIRETLAKDGYPGLEPERAIFPLQKEDHATWLYWMKRAVDGGLAKLVRGKLPDRIEGKPRKNFVTKPRIDPRDKMIERLTAILFAQLPPEKQKAVREILDAPVE
jgi:hypothetical protein